MTLSGDYVFITLVLLALGLTVITIRQNVLLFKVGSFLSWLTLGIMFMVGSLGTSIGDDWTAYLGWLFIVMSFGSLLINMDAEITREKKGKRWSEWGSRPKEEKETSYDSYKKELRRRRRR